MYDNLCVTTCSHKDSSTFRAQNASWDLAESCLQTFTTKIITRYFGLPCFIRYAAFNTVTSCVPSLIILSSQDIRRQRHCQEELVPQSAGTNPAHIAFGSGKLRSKRVVKKKSAGMNLRAFGAVLGGVCVCVGGAGAFTSSFGTVWLSMTVICILGIPAPPQA